MTRAEAALHLANGFRGKLHEAARFGHAWRLEDIEDAVASTLDITLRKLPEGLTIRNVEAWAVVVCKHEAFAIVRRRARDVALTGEQVTPDPSTVRRPAVDWIGGFYTLVDRSDPSPEDHALDGETAHEVREAFARLPAHQQAVLGAYRDGLIYQEIAGELGVSYRSVNRALWRAKRNMRRELCGVAS